MISRSFHPYLRDGWGRAGGRDPSGAERILPDVNPADEAVARMRRKFGGNTAGELTALRGANGSDGTSGGSTGSGSGSGGGGGGGGGGPGGGGGATDPAVAALAATVAAQAAQITNIYTGLAAATITCNGDGTATLEIPI